MRGADRDGNRRETESRSRCGRARRRRVEIGYGNQVEVENLRRVSAGDVVILHPSNQWSDGARAPSRQGGEEQNDSGIDSARLEEHYVCSGEIVVTVLL
jgi:hypothetical protein